MLLLGGTSAQAATRTVCSSGCDHLDIGAALAAANANDIIELQEDQVNEGQVAITIPLTLRGDDPVNRVIIDENINDMVKISGAEVTLQDLQITSRASGRCIKLESPGGIAHLDNVRVYNCDNGADGGGLRLHNNTSGTVTNSQFESNHSNVDGGHIDMDGISLVVTGSDFTDGTADGDGAAINVSRGTLEVHDSTFTNNAATFGAPSTTV